MNTNCFSNQRALLDVNSKIKIHTFFTRALEVVCFTLLAFTISFEASKFHSDNYPAIASANGQELSPVFSVDDDTSAIQSMIDRTPYGGKLVIPPGVYNLNKNQELAVNIDYGRSYSALKITKPITIIMDGVTFKTKTQNNHGIFWIYKASNVHLKGGSLLGDSMPTEGLLSSRVAVLVQESTGCTIENMKMNNFSQGINLFKTKKCTVKKVTTENNKGSGIISIRSKYSTIDSSIIRNSGDGHLSLYGGGRHNIVSNNIVSEDRPNKKFQQGITLELERYSTVINNTVSGFYYGIDVKNGSMLCNITRNTVTNNLFNIAVRAGDTNSKQLPSNNIIILNNNVLNPRKVHPNAGIYVASASGIGHIIQGNHVNQGDLIYGSLVIEKNLISRYVSFSGNLYK
ncbi:right-handed parallel beta-helix repeat-containing protein [Paenibacillus mendelii]|uniref:Right-handed parallel beta-helix repeat-containing protein n=1 Tax=Paenibacillus mendelii TaxID=206163 RepID=A0ABV6JK82_9BACL|nr:right-handed parallel beta-helix repeat-containing protein [Paenibacillus mendelii]MCQ6558877.1 right-handed parallel beta-helix repeat-containing protein [Paenibacillus mendelii]